MSTVLPPPSKKQKKEALKPKVVDIIPDDLPNVLVKFQAFDTGEFVGNSLRVPGNITEQQLEELLNSLNQTAEHDKVPYTFSVEVKDGKTVDIKDNLYTSIIKPGLKTTEDNITLIYTPRAVFKVKPVTRSSVAITGHGFTILCSSFAPNTSARMVTGSGDNTARIWDCDTQTPMKTLSGHSGWVLCVAYSPCGRFIATGSMDNTIRIWDAVKGESLGKPLRGHNKWITSLSWEPFHLVKDGEIPRLVSGSKDSTLKIWDPISGNNIMTLSGHTSNVSCVKWGGLNLIYSGSHDKTIRCWDMNQKGLCINTLKSHGHWVNHLSLSTDYVLQKSGFDEKSNLSSVTSQFNETQLKKNALINFEKVAKRNGSLEELLCTCSDDFTMYLWNPSKSNKPIVRLTGHQKLVNHVSYSPDGRYIASASFDNSIKIWDGRDGKFVQTFRGHVAAVYKLAWSSDCRLLVSCSKDTTLKVWDIKTKKLAVDLPGHTDEIYTVDWSLDGKKVCSGGKDKSVRIWTH
ncbi:ribosome assembly [Hanseniaspora valbyensis]